MLPGDRAGLRRGEHARRDFDVFLQRPASYRNAVWEGDHVAAPVEVDVEGRRLKPWVTWFVDVATNAVRGTAVTAGPASGVARRREAPIGLPGVCLTVGHVSPR
jgi:putative transposase